jgi:Ala-tRNA(Pro) deacylase
VTFTTKRTDFKRLKQVVGEKVAVVKQDEMEAVTNQKSGAVTPLGYESSVAMIVDEELFKQEKLVFAPARPDQTMVILAEDLREIISLLENKLFIYSEEDQ